MTRLPRTGHAPGQLREEFLEVVDLIKSEAGNDNQDQITERLLRLTGRLWNCTDIVPAAYRAEIRDDFGGPFSDSEPMTYAQASRMIRADIERRIHAAAQ